MRVPAERATIDSMTLRVMVVVATRLIRRTSASRRAMVRARDVTVAVTDSDGEVRAGEDHDVAGIDDLAGRGQFGVSDLKDNSADKDEDLAIMFGLGTLMGVDREDRRPGTCELASKGGHVVCDLVGQRPAAS
jgi:hypothetical protein